MTATDLIRQIDALPAPERAKILDWMHDRELEESPEMLAALDAAEKSANERGTRSVSEVRKLLPQWISRSV